MKSDEVIVAEVMKSLRMMFQEIPEPDRAVITRWGLEPNFRVRKSDRLSRVILGQVFFSPFLSYIAQGTYSHSTIGRSFTSDSSVLSEPVGQISFAGEATAGAWFATTNG